MMESMRQAARVDLGRYQLAYRCHGAGRPTVVLEAGGGCAQDSWAQVFDTIAQFATVVSYDRASIGASDRGPRRRTCHDMVYDLHDMLLAAEITGPYVLVGHSFGGQIVRLFAQEYPQDVVGWFWSTRFITNRMHAHWR